MQSLYGAMNPITDDKPFDSKKIILELGQWIDVRDTIDQWLEAQVTKIREGQVYVHYNGWGNHWDEWIDCNSPRIAPFRTYTLQYSSSHYLSPAPNIPTDSENHEIPARSPLQLQSLLLQTSQLVEQLQGYLGKFATLATEISEEEKKEELSKKRTQLAAQLAPLLDRTGRILCDFAPHLAHTANPEEFKDEQNTEPFSYQIERADLHHDTQVPLIANQGDVSIVSNLLDRVIFGDSPSLEVHVHAFLNPPSQQIRPQSVSPVLHRPFLDMAPSVNSSVESLPIQPTQSVETETQTEAVSMCDSATSTDNVLTHTSVGVQTRTEETSVKISKQETKEIAKSPAKPKIKAHVGHTIIRESPKMIKGKCTNGEFRITKTSLKMGPALKKTDHK